MPPGCTRPALAVAEGTAVSTLLDSGYPAAAFFTEAAPSKSRCGISARRDWPRIIEQLATAALEMRKQATLAAVIAQRVLLVRSR